MGPETGTAVVEDAKNQGREPGTSTSASQQPSYELKISRLKAGLKQYPDFPQDGILFEDIMPLFSSFALHNDLIDVYETKILQSFGKDNKPDVIVGLDARGFLFGPTLALRLGAGFVPVRKQGKLPGKIEEVEYMKEYGKDVFVMQSEAFTSGQKVLVVDDLIATGGSAAAAGTLVKKCGGHLLGYMFIIELGFLGGRAKLDAPVHTLLESQSS